MDLNSVPRDKYFLTEHEETFHQQVGWYWNFRSISCISTYELWGEDVG